jgi:hypothetical protein
MKETFTKPGENRNENGLKKNSPHHLISQFNAHHDNSERKRTHRVNLDLFIAGNTLLKEHRFISLFSHHDLSSIFYYDCLSQNIKLFSSKEMLDWKNNSLAVMPFPEPLDQTNIFSKNSTLHVHFAIPNQEHIIYSAQEKTLNFYFLLSQSLKTVYKSENLIFNESETSRFFSYYYDTFESMSKIIQKDSDKFKSHMTDWTHFMDWKYQIQETKLPISNGNSNSDKNKNENDDKPVKKATRKLKKILAMAQKHQINISDDTTLYRFSNSEKLHSFSKKFERQKFNQKKLIQRDVINTKITSDNTDDVKLPVFSESYQGQCLELFSSIQHKHALPGELEQKLQTIMALFQQIANYKIEKLHHNLTYFDQLLFWQLKSLLLAQKTPELQMDREIIQIIDKIQPQLEALNEEFLNTLLIQQDNHSQLLKVTLKDKFKF